MESLLAYAQGFPSIRTRPFVECVFDPPLDSGMSAQITSVILTAHGAQSRRSLSNS